MKTIFRHINKNKVSSMINILGLSIGLATVFLIYLFVQQESGYDQYHSDVNRLYRIGLTINDGASERDYAFNVPPLGPELKAQLPQVEESARIMSFFNNVLVKHDDKQFYYDLMLYADPSLFSVLSFSFLEGNASTALTDQSSVVITKSMAEKLFGTVHAAGKILIIDNREYHITAVLNDAPQQTHLPYNMFVSIQSLDRLSWMQDWSWPGIYTYVKLKANTNIDGFREALAQFARTHSERDAQNNNKYEYILQPVTDIHLSSGLEYEFTASGNMTQLFLFIIIGLLVLFIAIFNYINLTTAQTAKRAKEFSMRRIVGANKAQLVQHIFKESLVFLLTSLMIAILLTMAVLPLINSWLSLDLHFTQLLHIENAILLLCMIILIGGMIGIYPALMITAFKPITLIKKGLIKNNRGLSMRKVLVTVQFVASILLVIVSIVIGSQIKYMKNKNLGFDKQQKLIIPVTGIRALESHYKALKTDFTQIPTVRGAAVSASVPGQGAGSMMTSLVGQSSIQPQMVYYAFWDYDFQTLYDIPLLAGRGFNVNNTTDAASACLINKSALAAFGWSSATQAIGQRIKEGMMQREVEIIGVIDDYHYLGLQHKVDPLLVQIMPSTYSQITLLVNTTELQQTIHTVKETWTHFFPDKPFEYFFLDESFDRLYQSEEQTERLTQLFTFLALFISNMGIGGLVALAAEQKIKEIGIRKILGANFSQIITGLNREIFAGMLAANIIAWPIAYYSMNKWLGNYAYHIHLTVWPFVLAGLTALLVAVLTTSWQTIRSATANPVDALRYE